MIITKEHRYWRPNHPMRTQPLAFYVYRMRKTLRITLYQYLLRRPAVTGKLPISPMLFPNLVQEREEHRISLNTQPKVYEKLWALNVQQGCGSSFDPDIQRN